MIYFRNCLRIIILLIITGAMFKMQSCSSNSDNEIPSVVNPEFLSAIAYNNTDFYTFGYDQETKILNSLAWNDTDYYVETIGEVLVGIFFPENAEEDLGYLYDYVDGELSESTYNLDVFQLRTTFEITDEKLLGMKTYNAEKQPDGTYTSVIATEYTDVQYAVNGGMESATMINYVNGEAFVTYEVEIICSDDDNPLYGFIPAQTMLEITDQMIWITRFSPKNALSLKYTNIDTDEFFINEIEYEKNESGKVSRITYNLDIGTSFFYDLQW